MAVNQSIHDKPVSQKSFLECRSEPRETPCSTGPSQEEIVLESHENWRRKELSTSALAAPSVFAGSKVTRVQGKGTAWRPIGRKDRRCAGSHTDGGGVRQNCLGWKLLGGHLGYPTETSGRSQAVTEANGAQRGSTRST